jgi:Transposase DDE domain
MKPTNGMDEDWGVLVSFLPEDWERLAIRTDALKGLRRNKSAEKCLRTLLMHLACGYSLRETALRAREARLANLSDVALLKRLRKSEQWLYELCRKLFEQSSTESQHWGLNRRIRLVDATHVSEPGKTGSLWRIHYSLSWPSLRCDYFRLSSTSGSGSGESLSPIPVQAGDCLLADRGYSSARGIHQVVSQGADVILRLNPRAIRVLDAEGQLFKWAAALKGIAGPGQIKQWPALLSLRDGTQVTGRICVIAKSQQATERACKKLRKKAYEQRIALEADTLLYAGYILVFTTLAETELSAGQVLEWYRLRWQIELVFKRFKQIAQLGHLPKNDPQSARAWLYGKMLVALLVEKLIAHARSVSPWGYPLQEYPPSQPMA